MQRWRPVMYLAATFLCFSNGDAQEWGYEDTASWARDYPQCNGSQQSPIALSSNSAQRQWSLPFYNGPISVDFQNYDEEASGSFTNTGHTVQMTLNYNDKSTTPQIKYTANGITKIFSFRNIHFHWPSEHVIDDQRYPLEMHMVHQSDDNAILVLGYLFKASDRGRRSSSGMDTIGEAVQELADSAEPVPISNFAPASVLQRDPSLCDYFQYNGSLTTPPCTEGVTWLVYKKTLPVKDWQLEAFDLIADTTGPTESARPLQRINGRTIINHQCVLRWWWWW